MHIGGTCSKLIIMKQPFLFLGCCLLMLTACAQKENKPVATDIQVGGSCEDCEAIYECPVRFDSLTMFAWLPDWDENSSKKIAVNGIVYQADGKTPAPGVVIYIYHTDQTGIYPKKGDEKGVDKKHGYLRGWMKTNEKGEYKFFTLRPGSYPQGRNPAHIHAIIKEPGKTPYWIDDFLFDNDPYLTADVRKQLENRGGNGILTFYDEASGKSIYKSERHIYLGKNVSGWK